MKIVKEHITRFEKPSSEEDFKDKLFQDNYDLDEYRDKVVDILYRKWPPQFRKYLGITKIKIEKMISYDSHRYELIKNNVYDLWDFDQSIHSAADKLYGYLNQYFQASANVM